MINVQVRQGSNLKKEKVFHVWVDGKYERTYSDENAAVQFKTDLELQYITAAERRHLPKLLVMTIENTANEPLSVFEKRAFEIIEKRARQLSGKQRTRFVARHKGNGIWKVKEHGITIMINDHKRADVWTVDLYFKGGE